MTEFHFFSAPTDSEPGTLNPVYELLDFPIAMGRAEEFILVGPAPERPLVNGREVTDPRLVRALAKPVELDRAEVLDRSAKLAGVLTTLGVVPSSQTVLTFAEDVDPLARALSLLAAARIGLLVDLRTARQNEPTVLIHPIDADPVEPGRASVKVTRSRFEGVGVTIGSHTANLDQAMRDSRVEFAAVAALNPDHPLIITDEGGLDARQSREWLATEVLTGS